MSWRFRLIILVSLVILVLVTISVNTDPAREPSLPEKALLEIVGSFQDAMVSSARGIENLWRGYFYLAGLREENRRLQKTVDQMHQELVRTRELRLENARLSRLLEFSRDQDIDFVGAYVVGWGPGPWFKTITINRGSVDGISKGMAVLNDQGVVGRIVEVSPRFSKVLLVTDYNSSVDALVQRTRVRGVFSGRSEQKCSLQYVRNTDDLKVGDLVVTSGMGGAFPRGIPLGTVSRIQKTGYDIFMEIETVPSVDFDHLEEVLVARTEKPPF